MISVYTAQPGKSKKLLSKAAPGRGPKRAEWVTWLYSELVQEFNRYRKAGVKFSPALLGQLAKDIVSESQHPVITSSFVWNNKRIIDTINNRWIQRCMEVNNIVGRAQTGKLMASPARTEHIEKEIAYHLGVVSSTVYINLLYINNSVSQLYDRLNCIFSRL